jgi:hypothetical protein
MNTAFSQSKEAGPKAIEIGISPTLTEEPEESADFETREYDPHEFVDRLARLALEIRRIYDDLEEADPGEWDVYRLHARLQKKRCPLFRLAYGNLLEVMANEIGCFEVERMMDVLMPQASERDEDLIAD